MNATAIIERIRKEGGDLQVQGADIVLRAAEPLPSELVGQVRQHKQEILGVLYDPETLEAEFQRTGRLRIESDWAGIVWLVATPDHTAAEDGVVYYPEEICFMVKLTAKERKTLHGFKKQFGGRIEGYPRGDNGEKR